MDTRSLCILSCSDSTSGNNSPTFAPRSSPLSSIVAFTPRSQITVSSVSPVCRETERMAPLATNVNFICAAAIWNLPAVGATNFASAHRMTARADSSIRRSRSWIAPERSIGRLAEASLIGWHCALPRRRASVNPKSVDGDSAISHGSISASAVDRTTGPFPSQPIAANSPRAAITDACGSTSAGGPCNSSTTTCMVWCNAHRSVTSTATVATPRLLMPRPAWRPRSVRASTP